MSRRTGVVVHDRSSTDCQTGHVVRDNNPVNCRAGRVLHDTHAGDHGTGVVLAGAAGAMAKPWEISRDDIEELAARSPIEAPEVLPRLVRRDFRPDRTAALLQTAGGSCNPEP